MGSAYRRRALRARRARIAGDFPPAQAGVLEVLLAMGNHLNAGGRKQFGSAFGFRLDDRLDDVLGLKRADGRGTLLQYAVGYILNSKDEAKHRDILSFPKELAGVKDAATVRAVEGFGEMNILGEI